MSSAIAPALTVKVVAALLNVDEKTVYRLAQKGCCIPVFEVAGTWRFIANDILIWIADQKSVAKAKAVY